MKKGIKLLCCGLLLCSFLIGSGMTCFRETEKELDNRQAVATEGHPVKTMKVESLLSVNPDNLEDLETYSDYIVKGIVLDGSESIPIYAEGSDDLLMSFTTVTPLQITQTYKGDFKEGECIDICEKYMKIDSGNNTGILHCGNYMPSTVGEEYIFFLRDCPEDTVWEGKYSVSYFERSRYPVLPQSYGTMSIDKMSNEELDLDDEDATIYKHRLKEVMEKYG